MERSNQGASRRRWAMLAGLAALTVAGCGSGGSSGDSGGDPGPTLFTMTNAAAGNQVVAFGRTAEGLLTAATRYDTGGLGTGRGLENQGAVALSGDHALLLAVNPGSDDVSVFRVSQRGLELTDRAPSGGQLPVSVTERDGLVYVLNRGGEVGDLRGDNVVGLRLTPSGKLTMIPGATSALSAATTFAAQIAFSPDGAFLVVTERGTGLIDTFAVDAAGLAGSRRAILSTGSGPFGFAFRNGRQFYVSEVGGGTTSGYTLDAQGVVGALTAAIPTGQSASCWLAITPDHASAFVTNTGSQNISTFAIAADGALTLALAVAATTHGGPLDLTITSDGRYLNVLTTSGDVEVFRLERATAALVPLQDVSGLPAASNGLAGF